MEKRKKNWKSKVRALLVISILSGCGNNFYIENNSIKTENIINKEEQSSLYTEKEEDTISDKEETVFVTETLDLENLNTETLETEKILTDDDKNREAEKKEISREDTAEIRPQIPSFGEQLSDFVPENWKILDSVTLDFNQDGRIDYVGVLEYDMEQPFSPRVLFAVASEKEEGYRLDFQDENLIRNWNEGGMWGDPYKPLEAEGTSFTTCSFGGSSWKWLEEFTYTYRDGGWYLTKLRKVSGYAYYITDYQLYDYEEGVGVRSRRDEDFNYSEVESLFDREDYDIEYEVVLDPPITLAQAGMRCYWSPARRIDREVASVWMMDKVQLEKEKIRLPKEESYPEYCDEIGMLYYFYAEGQDYLAYYRWEDKSLSVFTAEEGIMHDPILYKGKLYYWCEEGKEVFYYDDNDKQEIQTTWEMTGVKVYRMDLDGTNRQVLFEYDAPEVEENILESLGEVYRSYDLLWPHYEISGDEIVMELYSRKNPNVFYRMNLDGSDRILIGYVPKQE